MGYSPFLRSICFWGSFYVFYNYSGRDPVTRSQKYPSYAIFKEKIVKDTWRDGFIGDKIQTDFGHFSKAFREEIRGLFKK
jgi:hypothetical protein